MRNIFKVYVIREKVSGSIKYAGVTGKTLNKRWGEHKCSRQLADAQFQIELVQDELLIDQALTLEKMLIAQYDLTRTGWNKSPGGGSRLKAGRVGMKNSEHWRERITKFLSKRVICLETGIVYPSARQAAKELNLQYGKISLVCNGKRATTGGLHFRFVDETVEAGRNDQPQAQGTEDGTER